MELIRPAEEVVEEVLNREYVVKTCDTAWERLRRIMAMGAMYIKGNQGHHQSQQQV